MTSMSGPDITISSGLTVEGIAMEKGNFHYTFTHGCVASAYT